MPDIKSGAFLPTNFIWDVQQIQEVNVNSPEFKELLVRLYQNLNLMANIINAKETSLYNLEPLINGQLWFNNPAYNSTTAIVAAARPAYRKVYTFPLPTSVTTVAHGIPVTTATTFTRIYGVANDTSGNNYYPLPWASAAGTTNIELKVNATNIVITNNSTISFAICYVVLEFLQT